MKKVRSLFLEATSNCNAACLDCNRQRPDTVMPKNNHLDINVFKQLIDDVSEDLQIFNFEGSYSDSPMHPQFYDMCEYIVKKIPRVSLVINTNGSLRTTKWWYKLGKLLSNHKRHKVAFDLDGIDQKTQEKYRVKTNFNKIINNASAFIEGGGKAEWKMIPFDWNASLEITAKEMADNLGFDSFVRKKTTRYMDKAFLYVIFERWHEYNGLIYTKSPNDFLGANSDPDYTLFYKIIDKMRDTIDYEPDPNEKRNHEIENAAFNSLNIKCQWSDEEQVQIGFDGVVWQCCHLQSFAEEYSLYNPEWFQKYDNQYAKGWNNLYYNRIHNILNHRFFQKDLFDSFNNKIKDPVLPRLKVCAKKCGDYGVPNKQF